MVFSGIQIQVFLNNENNKLVYSYNNETITFNGKNTYLGIGNALYPVEWSILKIDSAKAYPMTTSARTGTISLENFTIITHKRISNLYQNSVILTMQNNNVRVSEIFSFLNSGIDASISIKNMENSSSTFIAIFNIMTNHHNRAFLDGMNTIPLNTNNNGFSNNEFYSPIPTNYSSITIGHIKVNWKMESNIFHGGTVISAFPHDSTALFFSTTQLQPNSVYNIDPILSPITPLEPTPCHICGGGGSGPPPSLTNERISTNFVGIDNSVTISGYVNPAGGAGICYEVYEYGGWGGGVYQYVNSPEKYSHTFSYSSLKSGQVSAIRMVVSNLYGTSKGNGENIILYTPPASSLNVTVYNSRGQAIAYYTMADSIMNNINKQQYAPGGYDIPMNFGIAVGWPLNTNTDGLWCIDQSIKNSYTNIAIYNPLQFHSVNGETQSSNRNAEQSAFLLHYLIQIANSFVGGLIPDPSFFTNSGIIYANNFQNIYYNLTSNPQEAYQIPGGSIYFSYPPLSQTNGSPAKLFGVSAPVSVFATENSDWLDVFSYSVTLDVMTGIQTGCDGYGPNYPFTSHYTSATLYSGVIVTQTQLVK